MSFKQSNKKKPSSDFIVIYGKHSVLGCINNPNRNIHSVFVTSKSLPLLDAVSFIKPLIKIVDSHYLDTLCGADSIHQGLALTCSPKPYENLHDFLNQNINKDSITILILDQVTDTRNIGALIRSAVAFDVDALIFPNTHSPKENSQMVKAAAGGIEKIQMISISNLKNAIDLLKKEGFWVIGLDANTENSISSLDSFPRTALVLGSEGKGMRSLTKQSCDFLAKIPMNNTAMESLNISNASSIALYEIYKNKAK